MDVEVQKELDKLKEVIVNTDHLTAKTKSKKKKIYSIGIDMAGYKFDREEANERR